MAELKYTSVAELVEAIGFQAESMQAGIATGEDQTEEEAFEAMLEGVIGRTGEYIDGMIGARYDVSTVEDNPILARICREIALYNVYTQFTRMDVPETIARGKADAEKQLLAIAQGKLDLQADDATFDDEAMQPEFESEDRALNAHMW